MAEVGDEHLRIGASRDRAEVGGERLIPPVDMFQDADEGMDRDELGIDMQRQVRYISEGAALSGLNL